MAYQAWVLDAPSGPSQVLRSIRGATRAGSAAFSIVLAVKARPPLDSAVARRYVLETPAPTGPRSDDSQPVASTSVEIPGAGLSSTTTPAVVASSIRTQSTAPRLGGSPSGLAKGRRSVNVKVV